MEVREVMCNVLHVSHAVQTACWPKDVASVEPEGQVSTLSVDSLTVYGCVRPQR